MTVQSGSIPSHSVVRLSFLLVFCSATKAESFSHGNAVCGFLLVLGLPKHSPEERSAETKEIPAG